MKNKSFQKTAGIFAWALIILGLSSCNIFSGQQSIRLDFSALYGNLQEKSADTSNQLDSINMQISDASQIYYSKILSAENAQDGIRIDLIPNKTYTLKISANISSELDSALNRTWEYTTEFTPDPLSGADLHIQITRAAFSLSSITLYRGETANMSAELSGTVLPDGLTWSSSNEAAVSLTNPEGSSLMATVTAVYNGTAYVHAIPKDNGFEAVCALTVIDPPGYEDYIARYDFEEDLSSAGGKEITVMEDDKGNYNGVYYPGFESFANDTACIGDGTYSLSGFADENEVINYAYVPASVLHQGDFTISFWYKDSADAQGLEVLLGQLSDTLEAPTESSGWAFYVAFVADSAGYGKVQVFADGQTIQSYSMAVNYWHSVVLQRSGSTLSLYLDGDRNSYTELSDDFASSGQVLGVGSGVNPATGARYYPAGDLATGMTVLMDALTFYDGAVNSEEILKLYQAEYPN